MTPNHRTRQRHSLAPAWILAGLIGAVALGDPQPVAAQTGTPEVCEVAESFAAADRETIRIYQADAEQQLAAQETWHQSLAALAEALPAGEARTAAETLRGAQTVASLEPWTPGQEEAYQVLKKDLEKRCNIELTR